MLAAYAGFGTCPVFEADPPVAGLRTTIATVSLPLVTTLSIKVVGGHVNVQLGWQPCKAVTSAARALSTPAKAAYRALLGHRCLPRALSLLAAWGLLVNGRFLEVRWWPTIWRPDVR